jgi:hypothetical protein
MHKDADRDRQMVYGMPLPNEGALPDPTYKNDVSKLYELDNNFSLPEKSKIWNKDVYEQFYYSKDIKNDLTNSLLVGLSLKKQPANSAEDMNKKFQTDKSKFSESVKIYKEQDIKIKSNMDCSIM